METGVLQGLARRVLGARGRNVEWELLAADDVRCYEFEASGGQLVVRGSDPLGAALGFHEYLKAALCRRVCWDTPLPLSVTSLPDAELTSGTSRSASVYYLNFCTFGYTAAYWGWPRWEREIDWMALHGVTMPLAAVGHEAVVADVYRELGLSDEEVRSFLGGPGYLPWQLMGCLDSWAGPLPTSWLRERETLGARIVARELEYGMTPVLPAFGGHIPTQLADRDTTRRDWWGFTTHLLAPGDPRFATIAQRVVEVQREKFGTAHLYAIDPFIEMTPPSNDTDYLVELATAVVRGLRAGDPDAVWVMQAWTFAYLDYWTDERIATFLDAVADEAMLVLDLWGDHSPQWRRFDGFRGKPWIWCTLHNFGGRNDLYGNLRRIGDECEAALGATSPPIGVGLAMEATDQNPAVYELALDLACGPVPDVPAWAGRFAAERYGTTVIGGAWARLVDTVYDAPDDCLTPDSSRGVVTLVPTFGLLDEAYTADLVDAACWYERAELFAAWSELVDVASSAPSLLASELGHDLASVAATAMSRACDRLILDVVAAWHHAPDELAAAAARFLAALDDLDSVLSTRPELRLSTWESAAAHAAGDDARSVLLDNARRIISVWDTGDKPKLTDYAARLWSGLVGGLYRERWRTWVEELTAARRDQRDPHEASLLERIDAVTTIFLAGDAPRHATNADNPLAEHRGLLTIYGSHQEVPST